MRKISAKKITSEVSKLCIETNNSLGEDVISALKNAKRKEKSPLGKSILSQIVENIEIAKKEKMPICQDTGITVVFVQLGQNVQIIDGDLNKAINRGVEIGYKKGYLRKSVVNCPLERKNTKNNTPAIIHTEIVKGDKIKITVAPKGAGSENMSKIFMLKPSAGLDQVKSVVLHAVDEAHANPCPPIVLGIGLGGNFEQSALLSKKALLRKIGSKNKDKKIAKLEQELLKEINHLGIGPMGLGGTTTALAVHIETAPCHIASLPVAINFGCWVNRHGEVIL